MFDQYRHVADAAFLEFCRNAPLSELRSMHATELESPQCEDWRLIALERAMLRFPEQGAE